MNIKNGTTIKISDMEFTSEILTIDQFITKVKLGDTVRFKNDSAKEFIEVFQYWNPNIGLEINVIGDKTTIKKQA